MTEPDWTERRALFEEQGSALFEEIAARGGVPNDDPLVAEANDAVALLLEIGLLRRDGEDYRVVDPNSVQGSVVTPLGMQGATMVAESSAWAKAFAELGQAYRRSPSTQDGKITELHDDTDEINAFLADVVAGAQSEILTAQPQAGRSTAALQAASDRDLAAVQRGVTLRTIYQHAARRNRATRAYVAKVSEEGAEVRTLDEFFNRLIVVDREVAVIPHGDNLRIALAIRDQGLVAYLVDIFERFWERGRPFTSRSSSVLSRIAEEQRAMTIRMLVEGHSDGACAKRLGVSPRTYAGYVADLKSEYDAQTRFQLGYLLGQQDAKEGRRSP